MYIPVKAKMPIGDVASCQFFLSELYAIKIIVVTYLLLAYNNVFFKISFNVFSHLRFLKYFSQM